ncbi:LysR family transcriptional regulator [Salinivibrio sp. ML290]|uniref:LysR family transcriptional regulator n=1 Tax=Salinivibrio sp. ML290 TaxID=1909468 RepID=UPI000988796F|nr:LysR family transcriptional regulator [Salinivibrio sp. ML290]OOE74373.1 LysR family transcriptional regulator [Salinivibrio sp. ML290]
MDLDQLQRTDLNLLVCLHVLLEECNVTGTAKRLHLSQSAVSKNLARLRAQFNDPLFTRAAHGLKPTVRAQALQAKLRALLNDVAAMTEPDHFQPHLSDRCFRFALVESAYPLLLPQFIGDMLEAAPAITLNTAAWDQTTFDGLARGNIDFGITGKDLNPADAMLTMMPPKGVLYQELCQDHQCVLMRADHPALRGPWDEARYLGLRHVQVKCDGNDRWLLDYKLAERNIERDIAMYVPDFNSAASLCTYTDLVFTSPSQFAHYIAASLNLVVRPLPTPIPPMAYTLFWHQNQENDPGHQWLKALIISRCQQFSPAKLQPIANRARV